MRAMKVSDSYVRKVRKALREMQGNYVRLQGLTDRYNGGILKFAFPDKRLIGKIEVRRRDVIVCAFGQEVNCGHGTNSTGIRYVAVDAQIAFARLCCQRIGINLGYYFKIYREPR